MTSFAIPRTTSSTRINQIIRQVGKKAKVKRTHYFMSRLERRDCLAVADDIYIVWAMSAFQLREMQLSFPSLDLDMPCHRMDIAFHGIRRGLRTNFTLHSTALGPTEIGVWRGRQRSQHGWANREGFATGAGSKRRVREG